MININYKSLFHKKNTLNKNTHYNYELEKQIQQDKITYNKSVNNNNLINFDKIIVDYDTLIKNMTTNSDVYNKTLDLFYIVSNLVIEIHNLDNTEYLKNLFNEIHKLNDKIDIITITNDFMNSYKMIYNVFSEEHTKYNFIIESLNYNKAIYEVLFNNKILLIESNNTETNKKLFIDSIKSSYISLKKIESVISKYVNNKRDLYNIVCQLEYSFYQKVDLIKDESIIYLFYKNFFTISSLDYLEIFKYRFDTKKIDEQDKFYDYLYKILNFYLHNVINVNVRDISNNIEYLFIEWKEFLKNNIRDTTYINLLINFTNETNNIRIFYKDQNLLFAKDNVPVKSKIDTFYKDYKPISILKSLFELIKVGGYYFNYNTYFKILNNQLDYTIKKYNNKKYTELEYTQSILINLLDNNYNTSLNNLILSVYTLFIESTNTDKKILELSANITYIKKNIISLINEHNISNYYSIYKIIPRFQDVFNDITIYLSDTSQNNSNTMKKYLLNVVNSYKSFVQNKIIVDDVSIDHKKLEFKNREDVINDLKNFNFDFTSISDIYELSKKLINIVSNKNLIAGNNYDYDSSSEIQVVDDDGEDEDDDGEDEDEYFGNKVEYLYTHFFDIYKEKDIIKANKLLLKIMTKIGESLKLLINFVLLNNTIKKDPISDDADDKLVNNLMKIIPTVFFKNILNIDISFGDIDSYADNDSNIEKISSILSLLDVSRSNILCYLEDNKNKDKFLESALSNAYLAKELAVSLKTNSIKDKALEMANDTIKIISLLNTTENS
jgi:hypothetical protein